MLEKNLKSELNFKGTYTELAFHFLLVTAASVSRLAHTFQIRVSSWSSASMFKTAVEVNSTLDMHGCLDKQVR